MPSMSLVCGTKGLRDIREARAWVLPGRTGMAVAVAISPVPLQTRPVEDLSRAARLRRRELEKLMKLIKVLLLFCLI